MANIQITQLPTASTLTGTEAVPVVQNGVTVQTTTGAITSGPSLTQTFLTVGSVGTLANARYLALGGAMTAVDGGAGSSYTINVQTNPAIPGTAGMTLPTGTVAQRGGTNGQIRYNSDATIFEGLANGSWVNLGSASTMGSINIAAGTGLTATPNPITFSGTISLSVPVTIANGGTGQTTANAAFNALVPSQASNTGKYLTTDGTNTSWAVNPLGTVTSVGLSAPAIFTVTNSPVTTSGTLTLSYSGTALPIANGGTNATVAGITAFNNITGYTASGATGTTSTNLVFSTSPTLVTPALGTPTALVGTNITGTATAFNINGTVGATTPAAGTFTQLTVNGANLNTSISPTGTSTVTISPAGTLTMGTAGATHSMLGNISAVTSNQTITLSPTGTGTVAISPTGALTINPTAASTINNASIGATTASTGRFTSVTTTAGTASVAPINLTSGVNLTSATAGAMEYDGTVAYLTPTTAQRGVICIDQLIYQQATYNLTSTTAAQKLFSTTNGAVTLTTGLYEFECLFNLSGLSATSSSFGWGLAGTATYTQYWYATAHKNPFATAGNAQSTFNTAANTTIANATTNTTGYAMIKGTINVTVTGTVIPQVSLGVAVVGVVGIGSYFKIRPLGSTSVATVGNWS